VRVATFQKQNPGHDLECNSLEVLRSLQEVQDADLVCFPECYLTGYTTHLETAQTIAISLESDVFKQVLQRLRDFPGTVVLGLVERDENKLFNTAAVISNGQLLGRYRKTHTNEKCFSSGSDLPVFEVAGWRIGINICFDANFPDLARDLATRGAQVLVYPLNNALPRDIAERWKDKSPENLRQRALETGCWVVSADVIEETDDTMAFGCTQIVDPQGEVTAFVPEKRDGFAIVEVVREAEMADLG
jgi:5-aminopentanamidase